MGANLPPKGRNDRPAKEPMVDHGPLAKGDNSPTEDITPNPDAAGEFASDPLTEVLVQYWMDTTLAETKERNGREGTSQQWLSEQRDKALGESHAAITQLLTQGEARGYERGSEMLRHFMERQVKMRQTLIINRSDSKCGNCEGSADVHQKAHDVKLGWGETNGEPGCHRLWRYVSSEYSGMQERCLEIRPDLVWLDDEMTATFEAQTKPAEQSSDSSSHESLEPAEGGE